MKKKYIFFDLDGTIIDGSKGIYSSVNHAMTRMNRPPFNEEILRTFIGPPLLDSFIDHGMTEEEAQKAIMYYREVYRETGVYEMFAYEGIIETLQLLSQSHKLYLATSKPEFFAKKILDALSCSQYFTGIYGSDLEGKRSDKAAVIAYALESAEITKPDEVVMVGDRKHDCIGAEKHGIECVGVLYGFGSKEELKKAGAKEIVTTPYELIQIFESFGN